MIEKLQWPVNEFYVSDILKKINEIIDILNEDDYAQGCRTELPSLEDCKNIEQQDWQPNEMQNGFVDDVKEKKVDKLEERPIEPHSIDVNPEQWANIVFWQEKVIQQQQKEIDQLKQKKPDAEIIIKIFNRAYYWINYVGSANYIERINKALRNMQQLEKEILE